MVDENKTLTTVGCIQSTMKPVRLFLAAVKAFASWLNYLT